METIEAINHDPNTSSAAEFCPNPDCRYHNREHAAAHPHWALAHGRYHTKARGFIQRFKCSLCGKTCSTQTFSIHYWCHRTIEPEEIEAAIVSNSGQRQCARALSTSVGVIKNRLRRLARNYLAVYAEAFVDLVISEDCAFDGFESYLRSQYFPTNLNLFVGCETQAVYGLNGVVMRRKGRMSEPQKTVRALIDRHWRPRRGALRRRCERLFGDLAEHLPLDRAAGPRSSAPGAPDAPEGSEEREHPGEPVSWTLVTDEHRAYPQALKRVRPIAEALASGRMRHLTVSSRRKRTRENPLFAVNYIDRELRKDMADHTRETVRQAREGNAAIQRTFVELAHHTFAKPFRISNRVCTKAELTHGEIAGLTVREATRRALERVHTHRHVFSHLSELGTVKRWMSDIWFERYENPPVVNAKTGSVSTKRVPGALRPPQHMLC